MTGSNGKYCVLALIFCFSFSIPSFSQNSRDPHRFSCSNTECRVVRNFIKVHFCGASPFGNGPKDGCDIPVPKANALSATVTADFNCDWEARNSASQCKQSGEVPLEVRSKLLEQMHLAGLPNTVDQQVVFAIRTSKTTGARIVLANYDHATGDDLWLCEILAITAVNQPLSVLKKVVYQKTDFEVPTLTTWFPVDIFNLSGHEVFLFLGDAYEKHWFEAVEAKNGEYETAFTGLGYYL